MEKFVVVWTDSQNDVLGEETIVAQSLLALLQSLSCRVSLPEDAMGLIVDFTMTTEMSCLSDRNTKPGD